MRLTMQTETPNSFTGISKMQIDLTGRTALITGGSMGLGRAMGMKMAAAGANIVPVARRQEPLDETV